MDFVLLYRHGKALLYFEVNSLKHHKMCEDHKVVKQRQVSE